MNDYYIMSPEELARQSSLLVGQFMASLMEDSNLCVDLDFRLTLHHLATAIAQRGKKGSVEI